MHLLPTNRYPFTDYIITNLQAVLGQMQQPSSSAPYGSATGVTAIRTDPIGAAASIPALPASVSTPVGAASEQQPGLESRHISQVSRALCRLLAHSCFAP